ncbi:3-isopropylmalate dehydratase small subunit [Actinomadura sp. HBU206391]|uniref:3-isopropylmalate dehydratase small subunit n=1 Tax=Actinomadura sp. HBU206391 TaxID=2731692 RepID=UPI00164F53B2|nr:3-isopropylmalate dehydratase small subunit [Actinomadura sp. HBU206391]MBC6463122.1 3-isopropylmalate dehydratase small subunit [Actinomadura sp. HBU206391]
MRPFTVHTGTAVPLRIADVDTDQIIPARFCTRSTRTGHADALFADWRADPAFVLNDPAFRRATVLVAGPDFGIGSSREYAVWALADYGFRVVIAERFGDIFRANAMLNGLPAIRLPAAMVTRLWELIEADPATPVTVDLLRCEVRCADLTWEFELDEDTRSRLLSGQDAIGATLRHEADITAYERHLSFFGPGSRIAHHRERG